MPHYLRTSSSRSVFPGFEEGEDKHTHTEELLDGCEELLDGCEEVDESKRYTRTKMSTAVEKALGRTIAKRPAPNLLSDFSWGYL